jgi:hypothetical protein
LLDARAKYELAAATAKQIAFQAEGQYAKDMAIAKLIESKTQYTPALQKSLLSFMQPRLELVAGCVP